MKIPSFSLFLISTSLPAWASRMNLRGHELIHHLKTRDGMGPDAPHDVSIHDTYPLDKYNFFGNESWAITNYYGTAESVWIHESNWKTLAQNETSTDSTPKIEARSKALYFDLGLGAVSFQDLDVAACHETYRVVPPSCVLLHEVLHSQGIGHEYNYVGAGLGWTPEVLTVGNYVPKINGYTNRNCNAESYAFSLMGYGGCIENLYYLALLPFNQAV